MAVGFPTVILPLALSAAAIVPPTPVPTPSDTGPWWKLHYYFGLYFERFETDPHDREAFQSDVNPNDPRNVNSRPII